MTLIQLLPFMVGTFVDDDDDHWECFTLLCTISNLVCAFEATLEDSIYLAWIIETYLESFRLIYPSHDDSKNALPCASTRSNCQVGSKTLSNFHYILLFTVLGHYVNSGA